MEGIVKGEKADVGGFEGTVTDIGTDLFMSFDIPYDVLYLLPEDDNMWYSQFVISCNAPDGLYSVKLHQKETRPVSFLSGGK